VTGTEENKQVVRRYLERTLNDGDLSAIEDVVAEDAVVHLPTALEAERGREPLKRFVRELRTGFPDLRIAVELIFGERDRVVVRWVSTQMTHSGPYQGIPPTGRSARITAIDIFRVADGKVQEIWFNLDGLGPLQHLGLVPPEGLSTPGRIRFMLSSAARLAALGTRDSLGRRRRGRTPEGGTAEAARDSDGG
jgi:steroid delta-isomerase-like uncharacterized protein